MVGIVACHVLHGSCCAPCLSDARNYLILKLSQQLFADGHTGAIMCTHCRNGVYHVLVLRCVGHRCMHDFNCYSQAVLKCLHALDYASVLPLLLWLDQALMYERQDPSQSSKTALM